MALNFFVSADSLVGEMDTRVRALCAFEGAARSQYDSLGSHSGALRTMALRNRPFVQDTVFEALSVYYNEVGGAIFKWTQPSEARTDSSTCVRLQQRGNEARGIIQQRLSAVAIKF
jgi:hypothetical protein